MTNPAYPKGPWTPRLFFSSRNRDMSKSCLCQSIAFLGGF